MFRGILIRGIVLGVEVHDMINQLFFSIFNSSLFCIYDCVNTLQNFVLSGLESFPQHELAKRQMTGFGGMVTFFIKGDIENAKQFFKSSEV